VLYTGWHLPHVRDEFKARGWDSEPLPADVGYHSPVPMYEDQEPITKECEYLDGKPCYYDGSGLRADEVFDILATEGSDGVWRELEAFYLSTFGELE
jgi:hypothetical protein